MTLKERIEVVVVALCRMLGITIHKDCGGVIVEDNGKFLLVQEKMKIPGIFLKWNLPMGRKNIHEFIHCCALREGMEETGYNLQLESIYYFYNRKIKIGPIEMNIRIYSAKIVGGKLRVPPDLLDVRWFTFEEILKLEKEGDLIHPYIRFVAENIKDGKNPS